MEARRLVLVFSTLAACQMDPPDVGMDLPEGRVRATLMSSESGIQYADLDTPEALPWGPPGIFSVRGGYAIPDNVRGKITILNHDFGMAREIDLQGRAQGILAVAQDGSELAALDGTAVKPKLLWLDAGGSVKAAEIPLDVQVGPSGLSRDDKGLILEYGGGETLYRVTGKDGSMALEPTDSYAWNGHVYALDRPTSTYFHERKLYIDGTPSVIRVPNHLGAARILGPDADGGVRVLVEDVKVVPVVSVEQTIWHIAPSGEVISVAQVPIEKRLLAVGGGVALDETGEPVTLVPQRGALQFWHLAPASPAAVIGRRANLLPDEAQAKTGVTTQALIVAGTGCLTPAQMESNALEYLNVSTYISATSINNDANCTPRQPPAYLGSAGQKNSVSYDWGGFDSPSGFVAAMAANKKAGNLDQSYASGLSCSYGVDCSGFVSRVWGLTTKLSTRSIPNNVKPYTPATLVVGDVFNHVGDHVVVFKSYATNGINTYEATAHNHYDRVVPDYRPWSDLVGYQALRSLTNCTP